MTQQRSLVCAAAAAPLALMGLMLGFVMLFGGGGAGGGGGCGQAAGTAGEPPLIDYYLGAAARYRLGSDGYAYLAAINQVETTFGTNLAVSSAGAVGWMQFEPGTWARYGVSVTDPQAPADPDDPKDAIYTAARYLSASGAPADWSTAIYAYNHSATYVTQVEGVASGFSGINGLEVLQAAIDTAWGSTDGSGTANTVDVSDTAGGCGSSVLVDDVTPVAGSEAVIMPNGLARPGADAPASVQAMIDAGDRIAGEAYSYGGGHCVAAMNQTAPDPDACPGDQENGQPGFDCSSATSYLLWAGGYQAMLGGQPQTSGGLERLGVAGPDPAVWVSWWATPGHVFIEVDGLVMDTVHGPTTVSPAGAPATGPRWQASTEVQWELTNDTATGRFVVRHLESL